MPSSKGQDAAAQLSRLTLDGPKKTAPQKKKKEPVADSWEDESSGTEDAGETDSAAVPPSPSPAAQGPGSKAPPPTPSTPSYNKTSDPSLPWDSNPRSHASPSPSASLDDDGRRRPEKTDAVARRMIASALGVKVPRMTEEQRAYDRSVREQERKRREQEKLEEARRKEEAEKAKAAMWDD
ncbi:hypothetical protein B0T11DRAFT_14105 [Plectosphaerella cucumerina]|jgi:hypothetical protein|uniref:Uncharacterized protein n=1 Tax=Plectosphaerella cucumerina TaxID=40658 RepID=A0A8K0TVF1_9PEZI|nr:hypothetical protein B0T11DRAFT_14105 [Plectosphaerella cucumerina]